MKSMILTICQRGNVRSATLAVILKDWLGYKDVIALGVETTMPETLAMLMGQAMTVFVVGDEGLLSRIPHSTSVHFVDVGVDKWLQPMHPSLVSALLFWLVNHGFDNPSWDVFAYEKAARDAFLTSMERG